MNEEKSKPIPVTPARDVKGSPGARLGEGTLVEDLEVIAAARHCTNPDDCAVEACQRLSRLRAAAQRLREEMAEAEVGMRVGEDTAAAEDMLIVLDRINGGPLSPGAPLVTGGKL